MKKEPLKVRKLKERIRILEVELENQRRYRQADGRELDIAGAKYQELEKEWKEYRQTVEGRRMEVVEENRWLKRLIELIVIPENKMAELAKLIEAERKNFPY
jgi:capsule polysaccharide export protein KpsE/RkpR